MSLHPAVVHFPVALLLTSTLFEILERLRPGKGFGRAGLYTLAVGVAGAVASVASGLPLEEQAERVAGDLVEGHEAIAILSTLLFAVLLGVRLRRRDRFSRTGAAVYLTIALVGTGMIGFTGYLGGQIAHGERNGRPPSEFRERDGNEEIERFQGFEGPRSADRLLG